MSANASAGTPSDREALRARRHGGNCESVANPDGPGSLLRWQVPI